MNKVIVLFSALFLSSCFSSTNNPLEIDAGNVSRIEVHTGLPKSQVEFKMKDGFESDFIQGLNSLEQSTPMKFAKTHKVMIYYNNGHPDMIMTNGSIYWCDGNFYKGSEDLINKYKE